MVAERADVGGNTNNTMDNTKNFAKNKNFSIAEFYES